MEQYISCYTCSHERNGYCLVGILLGVQKEPIINPYRVMKAEECMDYAPKYGLMPESIFMHNYE